MRIVTYQIRVPDEIWEKVRKKAGAKGMTINDFIVEILEREVES